MKNFVISLVIIVGWLPFTAVRGQDDATIKAAKAAAASAGLRQYQKFSTVDSIRWIWGGDASLSFASTALTNWTGGGEDQVSVAPAVNLFANYKKGKWTWENYGIFNYSIQKNGERKAVKNSDNLQIVTKLGHQVSTKWFYNASFLARTQFSPGYRYSAADTVKVSDFLAPISLYLSLGMDYRPNKNISFAMSPLMGKATFARADNIIVLSNAGLVKTEKDATGAEVKVPSHSRYEFGGGIEVNLNGTFFKNKLSCNSQIVLFTNYANHPENVDVTWWVTAKYKIYKNISADIRFDLLFDDDKKPTDENGQLRGAKVQMKSYAGISVFYQF